MSDYYLHIMHLGAKDKDSLKAIEKILVEGDEGDSVDLDSAVSGCLECLDLDNFTLDNAKGTGLLSVTFNEYGDDQFAALKKLLKHFKVKIKVHYMSYGDGESFLLFNEGGARVELADEEADEAAVDRFGMEFDIE